MAEAKSCGVIGTQLRAMIRARGETASELGRQAGVDPGVIQRFLNEERDIRVETLDRLAEVMGLRLIEGAKGKARPPRPARGAK